MPEMPELEILREGLAPRVLNRPITRVVVHQPSAVKTFYPPMDSLVGQRFVELTRRGKFVIFGLESGDSLVVHLMKSGWLTARGPVDPCTDMDAVTVTFRDGSCLVILEKGSKRKACVYLVRELTSVPFLSSVGIEPFDANFTAERLFEYLQTERMQLKSFLIDQRFVAGLGNSYTDEILSECGLSPFKITTTLTFEETQHLQASIRRVLERGMARIRSTFGDRMLPCEDREFVSLHAEPPERCTRCGAPLPESFPVDRGGRPCPACHSSGRVAAARRGGGR